MSRYELVFILSPEIAEEQVGPVVDKVTQAITTRGGAVEATERWGRRRLAYPIKHFTEGNYVLTRFQVEAKAVAELESQLKVSEEVIRHLLVKMDPRQVIPEVIPAVTEASPAAQPVSEEAAAQQEVQ